MNTLKKVPPEKGHYIAGFVDGEGSFYMSARKRPDYASGWKFSMHFNISNGDRAVLEICKKFLGCGEIRESKPQFYVLEVTDREKLKTFIVPFFKKFGFLSNKKKAEFRLFQQALTALDQGIKTPTQLQHILTLRTKLNEFRQARNTNTDEMIQSTFRFMKESSETIR